MSWDEVFKFTSAIFASVGGAAAIIFGLSSWLGKVWAGRILEADKVKYQSEFEVIKRYSEKQFHLYSDLWSSLCDLRIAAEELWDRASLANARKLAEQLKKTEEQVTRSSLLIEDRHYESLKKLMKEFGKFRIGKVYLIDLRSRRSNVDGINDADIESAIQSNRVIKEQYSSLLAEIESSFKTQMKGRK